MVIVWHFAHGFDGNPVPFNQAPALALLDEGHAGVALFMVLSGYLFAKLINGRRVDFGAFLWNRALRLLPLFGLVMILVGLRDYQGEFVAFVKMLVSGVIFPTLPNGGWSITSEAHFYLLLPLLLWATGRWNKAPLVLVAFALCVRILLLWLGYDVQDAAYWTIIGRLDQFSFGIFFFTRRDSVKGPTALLALAACVGFYGWFDAAGGFYNLPMDWPWVFIPTVEGAAFGVLIAWYDAHPFRPNSRFMRFVQKAGEYSYSIYLLHFFAVFGVATLVDQHVMPLTSLYLALPWAALYFVAMVGIGHLSYVFIEAPPLRYRKKYILADEDESAQTAATAAISAAAAATMVPPPRRRSPL